MSSAKPSIAAGTTTAVPSAPLVFCSIHCVSVPAARSGVSAIFGSWPLSAGFLFKPIATVSSAADPEPTVKVLSIWSRLWPASTVKRFVSATLFPPASQGS